ncbi:PaaX family transcriptional regulator C-terminal domain-containing protein [Agromyces sp. H66]|uniref:PaaX family transcriptional regulator n=1 Tax=Agromyces sp. H66 TaxID=2529859 RepID=UPI0010AA9D8A|nr:PaaX family transcriptional regulator C-terminal domain-containing protein [Agromyces sp. H66]
MTDRLLPRHQQGARSQQLLTVLLGDYWHLRDEPLPSAALVALLGRFGVTPAGARAAVQRLARRGFLVPVRSGRTTLYAVPPMSRERVDAHVRILFRTDPGQEWDGTWTLVSYSLSEDQRSTRNALREQLRQARFGSVHDGLWVRPGDARPVVDEILGAMGESPSGGQLAIFVGARLPHGDQVEFSSQAFGLDGVAADYRRFISRWQEVAARVGEGIDDAHEALQLRTSIMRDWRELRHEDPMLPPELLGGGFPFDEALDVCSTVYDRTGPAAEEAFRGILRTHAPELADFVSHHTFAAYRSDDSMRRVR